MNDIFSLLCQCLLIAVVEEITCRADDYQRLVNDARENYLNKADNADIESDAYLDQARRLYEEAYADRRREKYGREAPVARMDGLGRNRLQYPEIGNYLRPNNVEAQGYEAVRSGVIPENGDFIEDGTNGTSLGAGMAVSSFNTQSQFQHESTFSKSQSSSFNTESKFNGVSKIDDGKNINVDTKLISNKYIPSVDCGCESSKDDHGFLCFHSVNGGSDIKIHYDGFTKFNIRELINAINKWSHEYNMKIDVISINENKEKNIIEDTNRVIPDITNSFPSNIDINSIINGQIQTDNNINIDSIIDINSIIDKNDLNSDANTFIIPDITLTMDNINQINSYIQTYFNADFQAKFNAQFNAMLNIKAIVEAQAKALAEASKAKLIAEAKGRVTSKIIADFEKYTAALQQAKLQLQAQLKLVAQLMAVVKAKLIASNVNVQETFKIPIHGLDINEFIKIKQNEQSKGSRIVNGVKKIFQGGIDFGGNFGIEGAFGIKTQGAINGNTVIGVPGTYGLPGQHVGIYGGGGATAYGGGGATAYGGGGAMAYGGGGATAYGGGGAMAYGGAAAYGGVSAGLGASGANGEAGVGMRAPEIQSWGYNGVNDVGGDISHRLHKPNNIIYADDLVKRDQIVGDYGLIYPGPDVVTQNGIRGSQLPLIQGIDANPTSFGPYGTQRLNG